MLYRKPVIWILNHSREDFPIGPFSFGVRKADLVILDSFLAQSFLKVFYSWVPSIISCPLNSCSNSVLSKVTQCYMKMQIFLLSRRLLINLQSRRDITISDEGKKESRSHIQYFLSDRDAKLHPSATSALLKRGWRGYCLLLVKQKESLIWNTDFCQEISIEMFTGWQRKRAALDMSWNS